MTVSICVVAFNEEKFLSNLLNDFERQSYAHELIEIVLVNSMSSDDTRKLMEEFSVKENGFYNVVVVDNPRRVQASGWNEAIKNASGDIIIRIDAHTHIPEDFVKLNVENIEGGESVSGGVRPCIFENNGRWGRTLLEVENSLFGSSFNKCRRDGEKSYVKTMFHAAYKREVFAEVGGFNENLLRTEDNEMHHRIREAGYKLSYDPKIVSYQYARANLRKMIKQKYGNGKWIGLTLGVCPRCISLFHLIPLVFVIGIIATTVFSCFGWWVLAVAMWGMYGIFAVANTMVSIIKDGFVFPKLIMPVLFLILHVSYGVGTLLGLIQLPFKRRKLRTCDEIENVKKTLNKIPA